MPFIFCGPLSTILFANTLVALAVFIYGLWQPPGRRGTLLLFALFFLVCPLIGLVFTLFGFLINYFSPPQELDLSTVSFSKSRKRMVLAPDSETELNYAPLADALAVADTKKVRGLLIDILKNSNLSTFTGIMQAINDSDTEVSHYAATAVLELLSDFRANSRELLLKMQQYPGDVSHNLFVLEYFHRMLEMGIMNEREHLATTYSTNEVAENLFVHNRWYMEAEHYLWLCDHLIGAGDYALAETWVGRARKYRPNELSTYKACLHFYYAKKDSASFFACIQELKHSDVVVDKDVLELFRLYG